MAAYALAHLYELSSHPDVFEYLERIQSTMDPFGGRFIVHGTVPEVAEGEWPGTVVIIEFPGVDEARGWYLSPAYQEILPLRTDHIPGVAILVDGVGPGYDAKLTAARMREAAL
ncbi:DUF1330 domain-containing protein [Cryptosporangium sp. NPDC051539]|uniref:DUF1330 domain-containing protein n=1 Tax=Cryptosporangium sp. NPDC051539 TaxID=3363962 RepID=UPI00379B5217